ncbi:helicase-related protein [Rheinheimera gaetbuli]
MNNHAPSTGCWVSQPLTNGAERTGIVIQQVVDGERISLKVQWLPNKDISTLQAKDVSSGFKLGMDVMLAVDDLYGFGEGVILQTRTVAGVTQHLVEFYEANEKRWLPFYALKQVKGVKHAFVVGSQADGNTAERLRLKTLAHALNNWNENTGALSSLDIDPLPHQIHLVHRILNSGSLDWLIADDVGLGKTVETGMLLYALQKRGLAKRILLITPAGLTRQWQEEMHDKFGLGDFQIYGHNFHIHEPREWKMHDQVIASIDKLKQEQHLELLLQADAWDLVVFDEAHRLSRRQYGLKYDASERFGLAASLRRTKKARSMLLLSATPHQGMQDKFVSLLELLRPDRKRELALLSLKPELLQDMVIRNYKADVTDAEGNFVFHGKSSLAIKVPVNQQSMDFDKALQDYLQKGYQAGRNKGQSGNAIGFVMTVYRKLAASSVAAIRKALYRRLTRLENHAIEELNRFDFAEDERFQGEVEELVAEHNVTTREEFFDGEIDLLKLLIERVELLADHDDKLARFMDTLLKQLLKDNSNEKVLIFSEYRATQEYIKNSLAQAFGEEKVVLLHGGMSHDERRDVIWQFDNEAQFLISTEAGGEGINLQRHCHIMVNYDLPWNPMRLVQRIGRLYRYGQKQKVIVLNVNSPGTVDEQIIALMYQRIDQVVADMASVQGNEFNDALKDDILGELSNLLDLEEILEQAASVSIERTEKRITEALERAKSSTSMQRDLFRHVARFNPDELANDLVITSDHLLSFIEGMSALVGIDIVKRILDDKVLQIKLPEKVMEQLGTRSSYMDITVDREIARGRKNTVMMDMNAPLMQFFIKTASSYEFGGKTAAVKTNLLGGEVLLTANLRWQDIYGRRMKQDFAAFFIKERQVYQNPKALGSWLLEQAQTGDSVLPRESNQEFLKLAESAAHKVLASHSEINVIPEHFDWVSAAWLSSED